MNDPAQLVCQHIPGSDSSSSYVEEIPLWCDYGCWIDMIILSPSSWRLSGWYWISAKHPARVYLVFLLIICNKRGNGCKWSVKRPYIISDSPAENYWYFRVNRDNFSADWGGNSEKFHPPSITESLVQILTENHNNFLSCLSLKYFKMLLCIILWSWGIKFT